MVNRNTNRIICINRIYNRISIYNKIGNKIMNMDIEWVILLIIIWCIINSIGNKYE